MTIAYCHERFASYAGFVMLDRLSDCCRLLAVLCVAALAPGLVQAQTLWFVPPASDAGHQGFIRITNPTNTSTSVSFYGIDDAGYISPGLASFTLGAQETKQFNSTEIENGAPLKGLVGALGTPSEGNWYLIFSSAGVIEATALIRVPNGFLTSVQDADPNKVQLSTFHVIPTVNPAINTVYPSALRFVNPNNATATVRFFAYENSGQRAPALGTVSFTIGPFKAVHLTSTEIESGAPTKGLATGLGPGTVKWRITVSSDIPIKVMNFIYSSNGFITELPTESTALNEANFFYCSDFEGAMVFSQDTVPVYLGFFGSAGATESINNTSGTFGSGSSPTSMRNASSAYGSASGNLSAVNAAATKPPRALKNSRVFGAVTANPAITGISLAAIDANCTFTSTQRADQ